MFDLAILVILLIAAAMGYIKGLYASATGIISFLLAIYIASQFYLPVYDLLDQQIGIQDSLAAYIKSEYPVVASIEEHAELLAQLAPFMSLLLDPATASDIPASLTETPISQLVARNILLTLAFIGLYALVRMLLSGLQWYWRHKRENDGMDWMIRVAGAIVEVLKSLIIILVLLAVSVPVIEVGALLEQKQATKAYEALHESAFYPYFHPVIAFIQNELNDSIL